MTEQLPGVALDGPEPHPIRLVVTDDLRRNRVTVFLRVLLAIPPALWLMLWGVAVWFAVLAAWLVGLVTGRVPAGLHAFVARYVRYSTHVGAYAFLAADPFPGFSGAGPYPVDLEIAPPRKQSRLGILFRLLLAIPASIVLSVLVNVGQLVAFVAWFYALLAGTLHLGMRDVLAYVLRYNAQTTAYLLLLTGRYPSFSDD